MSIFEYNQEEHFCQIAEESQAAGWKKGKAEDTETATLANLRSLMETVGWSVEQAFDALKIPEEEREKYSKILKQ